MLYKGKEIGEPTLKMFEEYISRQKYGFQPQIAFDHFKKKGWIGSRGEPLSSVEAALNGYNGVYLMRVRRDSLYCNSLF